MFVETPAHTAIFAAIEKPTQNVIIEAVAGAGKTSTIVEALKRIPTTEKVVFLAFNASIAKELQRRVPPHVEARTLNSLGNAAWNAHLAATGCQRSRVDADKLSSIFFRLQDEGEISSRDKTLMSATVKLCRIMKSSGIRQPTASHITDAIDHFDVDMEDGPDIENRVIDLVQTIMGKSFATKLVIDFDDQLFMPVVYDVECPKYDRIFVDESQDLSPLQHELLRRSLRKGGQLVAVGDPRQAIYAFRGADSNSMNNLSKTFGCMSLPLHVSYRCPQAIVREAQRIVSHIQAHPEAPEGLVDRTVLAVDKADFRAGDLIVSRTTAPMVSLAFSLIRDGKAATVLGRDIGAGLTSLAKKLKATSVSDLEARVELWRTTEIEKLTCSQRVVSEAKVQMVHDKADTLLAICEGARTINDVLMRIQMMFSSDRNEEKITLSTVHKAKGLEADRVWILNPELMPHPMAKLDWQREQEFNLLYVAITRAKSELRFASNTKKR